MTPPKPLPAEFKKTCAYCLLGAYCCFRHVKIDPTGHPAIVQSGRTKTNKRLKCTFKDKSECQHYKQCETVLWRDWMK